MLLLLLLLMWLLLLMMVMVMVLVMVMLLIVIIGWLWMMLVLVMMLEVLMDVLVMLVIVELLVLLVVLVGCWLERRKEAAQRTEGLCFTLALLLAQTQEFEIAITSRNELAILLSESLANELLLGRIALLLLV